MYLQVMNVISIFEIFKIGVGPSSSHTLGPWKAANQFLKLVADVDVDKIQIHLYGSLSKTGKGHATDYAVQLGIEGYDYKTIPTADIAYHISRIAATRQIKIHNTTIDFDPDHDILFENQSHPLHPNTLVFKVFSKGMMKLEETFLSLGGGFVDHASGNAKMIEKAVVPFPIQSGADIIKHTSHNCCSIADIVFKNELSFRKKWEIQKDIDEIIDTMIDSVYRGCNVEGILPGGLNVKRRAKSINARLSNNVKYSNIDEWLKMVREAPRDFNTINQWVSCFALAVNEENASLSRVVTSPTNGAAGVIPAVLLYYYCFTEDNSKDKLRQFLYTAGEIGCIFKKGATISAAEGGCQAEIGVSSAMAAAGLTEVLGGSPSQAMMAAEIAMEHHLGLTCDPIGGLVQIPCIERNAMGAIKAITACNLALAGDPSTAIVNLDTIIKTMWDTAQDMNYKYKETSEGGLAFNLPMMPNC